MGLIASAGAVIGFIGMFWKSWDRNATAPGWWIGSGAALLLIAMAGGIH
jgi:hypothetical protein